ncbi:MAG: IclR family transcriptional regulator [Alphaproteobacteria bacterium]
MNVNRDVKTAGRTLALFEAFRRTRAPMTLTRLAAELGAPISSCHGLVRTLSARGYLYTSERTRTIYPTKRLFEIAETIALHDPILERVGPVLAELRDATGETILLGRRQGDAVIYLDVVEGRHTVRYSARPGDIKPLHSSAIGKALLGRLAPDERADLFARAPLARYTPATIVDVAALEADLAVGAARGWFATHGENVADVMGMAATADAGGEVLGLAIAAPLARAEANEAAYARALLAARDAIEMRSAAA